jgi:argininosuccinate lyase
MTHLSRFCEELVIWSNPRFGFVEIADRFATGSSIMPQKKNPDVAELIRGKTGRVNGHVVALLTLMKAQPLAYNRDNQEDKEPLFDAVDTLTACLAVFTEMLGGIQVKREAMAAAARQGHATATDLAEYLVRKGVPFREAHEAVAQAVRFAESRHCDLADLRLPELQRFSSRIGEDVYDALTLEGSLKSRSHPGGTAPVRVKQAIAKARKSLG